MAKRRSTTHKTTTTSTTTSTPTQTTAAPPEWYEPETEDIPARLKHDLARIGHAETIERALRVFPDALAFWLEGIDRPEAQRVWNAMRTQWGLIYRNNKCAGVPMLPEDPRKAFEMMILAQQAMDANDGKLPSRWPSGKSGSGGPGRKAKYTEQTLQLADQAYDAQLAELNDSKAAWAKVAELYGFPSGEATRKAVYRWKRGQN